MILNSPYISGSLTVTGNSTFTGTMTAQTLVVQTITSSISSITGSTNFGSLSSNTHTFTGSVNVSGSINASSYTFVDGQYIRNSNTSNANGSLYLDASNLYIRRADNGTNLMFVSSSGNVGIGTSSPDTKLQVAATGATGLSVRTDTSGDAYMRLYRDSTIYAHWYADRTNSKVTFGAVENVPLTFDTNGTERMRILSNGNVLINATSDPSVKFQVVQTTTGQWTGDFKNYSSNAYGLRIDLSSSTGATGGYVLGAYTQVGTGFFIKNDGTIGIGTTNPAQLLTLYSAGSTILRFQSGGATTDHWDAFSNTSARFYIWNVSTNNGAYLVYNSASGWTSVSDARWKTDWTDLGPSLSIINQLKIGRYKMLDANKQPVANARWDYGVKAQELLELIPDAVDVPDNPEDKHGVINNIVFYHAIKAIQELKAQNDTLQSRIEVLEQK